MRRPSDACTRLMLQAKLLSSYPRCLTSTCSFCFEKAIASACQEGRQGSATVHSLRMSSQSSSAVRCRLSPS